MVSAGQPKCPANEAHLEAPPNYALWHSWAGFAQEVCNGLKKNSQMLGGDEVNTRMLQGIVAVFVHTYFMNYFCNL